MQRTQLYKIVSIACAGGYAWLGYHLVEGDLRSHQVCMIKNVTGIPCPSCGSSRSVLSILEGNFTEAFFLNPVGYLIAAILLITPAWLLMDVMSGGYSFFRFYQFFEKAMKRKWLAIPAILLVISNWLWTILKGL